MYLDPGQSRLTCQLVTPIEFFEEVKAKVLSSYVYSIWHKKMKLRLVFD